MSSSPSPKFNWSPNRFLSSKSSFSKAAVSIFHSVVGTGAPDHSPLDITHRDEMQSRLLLF